MSTGDMFEKSMWLRVCALDEKVRSSPFVLRDLVCACVYTYEFTLGGTILRFISTLVVIISSMIVYSIGLFARRTGLF